MPIKCELEEIISAPADKVFAMIDDLPATAQWLPPCVSLEKLGSGPNAVGDKLKYRFKQGGKVQEMDGEIVDRVPGQRLHCRYYDNAFEVSVDLHVAHAVGGTKTTHRIDITPKGLMGKLISPLIRLGLRKQTRDAATNLKKLLERA